MSNEYTPLFNLWLQAERAAWAAEKQVYEANLAYVRGAGEPPSFATKAEANRLRMEAGRLYPLAMAEMADTAAALKPPGHGNPGTGSAGTTH
jgi:hypothetical protein